MLLYVCVVLKKKEVKIDYKGFNGIDIKYSNALMRMIPIIQVIVKDYCFEELADHISYNTVLVLEYEKAKKGLYRVDIDVTLIHDSINQELANISFYLEGEAFMSIITTFKQGCKKSIFEVKVDY